MRRIRIRRGRLDFSEPKPAIVTLHIDLMCYVCSGRRGYYEAYGGRKDYTESAAYMEAVGLLVMRVAHSGWEAGGMGAAGRMAYLRQAVQRMLEPGLQNTVPPIWVCRGCKLVDPGHTIVYGVSPERP